MEDIRLDVRTIPTPQRHPKIFDLFDTLTSGNELVLITDHEPRPLRVEFEHKRPDLHRWVQRHLGDGRWEVRLSRTDASDVGSPIAAILRGTAFFRDVESGWLETVAYHARRVTLKRNQIVAEQAVQWPYVGIVERGVVQAVLATEAGREQTMYEILSGDVFGEYALLDGGPSALRFVAVTNRTIAILLPAVEIRSVMNRFPGVGQAFAEGAAQHTRMVLDRFSAHLSESTIARVAHALLAYARPDAGLSEALEPLPSLTHNEIAMRAGTVKEVVSRAIADLEAAGAIERRGGHVVKLDRAKLTDIARSAEQTR